MKRLMMLMMTMVLFVGCQKDDSLKETTYTLQFKDAILYDLYDLADDNDYMKVEIRLVFSEYCQEHRVATASATATKEKDEFKIKAHSKTEYVTVRMDVGFYDNYYGVADFEKTLYIANVFYLEKGKDTLIEFGLNTLTSEREP